MQSGIRLGLLSSRIARRVFGTFVLCALGPLAVHVWMSTSEIELQLTEQAAERLELEAKTMTMSVAERVRAFATEVERVRDDVRDRGAVFPEEGTNARRRIEQNFASLIVLDARGGEVARIGHEFEAPAWTEAERRHLASGEVLLATRGTPADRTQLYLACAVSPAEPESPYVVALPNDRRFWDTALFTPPGTQLTVFDLEGGVLYATSRFDLQKLQETLAKSGPSMSGRFDFERSAEVQLGAFRTLFLRPQYLNNVTVVLTQSRSDVLAPARGFRRGAALSMALGFLLVAWLSYRQVRSSLIPVETLVAATRAVASKQLETRVTIRTNDEFEDLAGSFNGMAESLAQHARVERGLYDLGLALNAELDVHRLRAAILDGALRVAHAQTACLFVARRDGGLELAALSKAGEPGSPSKPTLQANMPSFVCSPLDPHNAAAHAARDGCTVVLNHAGDWKERPLEREAELMDALSLDVATLVCVPLTDHDGQCLGVLQVSRASHAAGGAVFANEHVRLVEAVAAQAAVALTKNILIEELRNLLTSISEVFALAIDEKSPYTGAHCRRVPDLTMMLVESAMRDERGPLREFRPNAEELYEIRIAALMHDCGKIVTPVHIIDKATKLETIHDRIEMVALRYEILARDAELKALRERLCGSPAVLADIAASAVKIRSELSAELEFLRQCNRGSENMPQADVERVRTIAAERRWTDSEGRERALLDENEVENLSVRYGTLRATERQIINDHIVVTLKMLERLEYPRGLRNVPLIAGAHHERMDGKGYPRGLTREQIPWAGRMIGVADIFEALTDSGRPYKKGKTLQESLEIMGRMAQTGHIDPDIFQRFVEDEVYLRYAQANLPPELIQPVDFARVPGFERHALVVDDRERADAA